ncbi:MAG TPA: response regulator [Moraxellaceae bacterium]|nr:response regulator [Moraxellaceae bacterium]
MAPDAVPSRATDWRHILLTLGGGLLLSAALTTWVQGRIEGQATARFDMMQQRETERLQEHLERQALGLRGMRGLFLDDTDIVGPDAFRRYVESRDLEREFPGARAWGFIERMTTAEARGHLAAAHSLSYLPPATPGGDEARVLRMTEPLASENLPPPGSDLTGNPGLQAALSDALQSGAPVLTAPFVTAHAPHTNAVYMVAPVHSGVRTPENVRGWVLTEIDTSALFQFLVAETGIAERVDITVTDVGSPGEASGPAAPVYHLDPPAALAATSQPLGAPALVERIRRIDLYGRTWELRYRARPAFYSAGERWLPSLTFGTVFLLSALGAALLLLRERMRSEVEARAAAMTLALGNSNRQMATTLAALPDAVVTLDDRGAVLACHTTPEFPWLTDDSIGQSLRSCLPATAGAEFDARLAEAATHGEARFEFDVTAGTTAQRVEARLRRRHDEAGHPHGYLLMARDISAAHHDTEGLRRRERRTRQLFMEAPQAIVLMSRTHYLDANPAALELLGVPSLPALQHVGAGMLSPLLQPDGRLSTDASRQLMARTIAEGPQHTEWMFQRLSDGESFPALVSSRAVTVDGETCFLTVISDLTPQKRVESALVQARDAAEAATREKSEFLATMSHEIRTPMNGVLGMAQLLSNTPLNQEQRDYLSTIQHSGQSLLTIINDILDFSKIEAGKLSFEEVPFDLQVAVEETCELLLPQLREKRLTLTLTLDPATPFHVIGDSGRFRQILLNYLSNALKFTPEGGITVALRAREQGRGAALFELSVADTGIGIERAKQERLFQKFAQADASTTRRFGGTGLGLAICKALVERMGGEVSMSSTPGQGSVFRATFWMSLDPNPNVRALPILLPALRDSHVLVIDDNDACRDPLVQGLNNAGLSASGVSDQQEALDALRQVIPRFVLLNAELGDGDIARLTSALRAEPAMENVPLLALSARPDRNDHAFCREHGISAWLPRPARLSWILTSLNILAHGEHEGVITRQTLVTHLARGKALPSLRRGIRVLLAEDNAVNQKVAARMLEKMGCHVDMAGNGLEAMVMVAQLPYDLVLMDVQMPEMDGITATRNLRAKGFAELPIIALTANNRETDRTECRNAGMNDFLAKPIRYEDLHACLTRWVKTARQTA